jgi:hypothetical protein
MRCNAFRVLILFVLVSPGLAFGMASFDYPVVAPVVSFVAGDVTVKGTNSAGWDKVVVGQLLASGDTIKTGPVSKAEISCATGKIRLYENTVIIVPEVIQEADKKDVRSVTLEDGAGLFRIKKRGVEKGFEVKTFNIIAGVKGTLFGVLTNKKNKTSRVAVFSGTVLVTDPSGSPSTATLLGRGQKLEVLEKEGFGNPDRFNPGDMWKDWKRLPNPDPDLLGVSGAGYIPSFERSDGDGDDHGDPCPPVVDNDGNVVVP